MTTRTTKTNVTFGMPFLLGSYGETLPAGQYDVEIDEERLEGLSFPVYRRVSALLHLHPSPEHPGQREILTIDPNELEEALRRDQTAIAVSAAEDIEAGGPTKALVAPNE